jgi:hypothetical protein
MSTCSSPRTISRPLWLHSRLARAGPRRERWQQVYGKGTTVHDDHGTEIDIHTMLGQGYFGLAIPLDELMASPDPYTIGGVPMLALDGPNRLIHAALHVAASDYTGMHSRRDVLQLALGGRSTGRGDRSSHALEGRCLIARGIVAHGRPSTLRLIRCSSGRNAMNRRSPTARSRSSPATASEAIS